MPLAGLAAKACLADEWASASVRQQRAVLSRLEAATTEHLRSLSTGQSSSFQAARASLAALTDVVTALQEGSGDAGSVATLDSGRRRTKASVDVCFSCSFTETLSAPQATVFKLILAEKLQDECSLLLSERLAREDEEDATLQQVGATAVDPSNADDATKSNSQRRRANRKKLLKKRRHDAEERVAQHQLLKKALEELKVCVRRKREQARRGITELLDEIVGRAVAEAQSTSSHTTLSHVSASTKKKTAKTRKKNKKRGSGESDRASASKGTAGSTLSVAAQVPDSVALPLAPPASAEASMQQQAEEALTKSPESRPLLSFLDKSYASPMSLPTFGPHPLYAPSSTASPPFFLSLAPHALPENEGSHQDKLLAGDDRTSSDSVGSNGDEQPKASSETKFGWYLPSLFSSEASMHTSSAASSLDWDFTNWQLKNDASSAPSNRLLSTGSGRLHTRHRAEASASSSKEYSLESFSGMLSVSPSRRDPTSDAAAAGEASLADGCSPESANAGATSDFLYQQGGFFDRQRVLKRRRRPLPFDYDEDDRGGDSSSDGNGDGEDAWGDLGAHSCCDYPCHNDRERQPCECNEVRASLDQEQRSAKRQASDCSSPPAIDVSDLLARLVKLEAVLEEKTQVRASLRETWRKERTNERVVVA